MYNVYANAEEKNRMIMARRQSSKWPGSLIIGRQPRMRPMEKRYFDSPLVVPIRASYFLYMTKRRRRGSPMMRKDIARKKRGHARAPRGVVGGGDIIFVISYIYKRVAPLSRRRRIKCI